MIYLRNLERYKSASAFAPIWYVYPLCCPFLKSARVAPVEDWAGLPARREACCHGAIEGALGLARQTGTMITGTWTQHC